MAVLIGMSAEVKGKTFPLDHDETTMGRSKDNVIMLDSATVSGHHCSVVREGDSYFIRDLESTNGTRLNSQPISKARLKPKDLLQVGSVEFMFDGELTEAVETQSFAEAANVEIAAGPVAAPDSFASISPFGARRTESRGVWFILIVVVGILALVGVVLFFFKLITTG